LRSLRADRPIIIPNSGDKLVGRELIVFVGPGFQVAFAEDEQAAKEVEATLDYLAAENPEPPNDIATQHGNAVYWWNGSEPPSDTAVRQYSAQWSRAQSLRVHRRPEERRAMPHESSKL
jgi:hypothetical protein